MSTGVAIVAIPRADDPVWKFSSEKVPHMTLLFLGDQITNTELYGMALYLQHVAKTSMWPFGMNVDSRGPLGPQDADVLFFSKDRHGKAMVDAARGYLLDDPAINKAYSSIEQYPEWTPHLTMGYPKTPAKPIPDAYGSLSYVSFDRVALWTGDYEGPEFRLTRPITEEVDMVMADQADLFLAHVGVKGMKWGVRKDTGHEGERVKTKKFGKLDKQYEKSFSSTGGFFKIHNEVAGQMNQRLPGLNAKYEKTNLNLFSMDPVHKATNDAYLKDYEDVVQESLTAAMSTFGSNASGTRRVKLTKVGQGADSWYQSSYEDIKHAVDDFPVLKITPKYNARGMITSQTIEEITDDVVHSDGSVGNFLEHFGVKGMKWGVRDQFISKSWIKNMDSKHDAANAQRIAEGKPELNAWGLPKKKKSSVIDDESMAKIEKQEQNFQQFVKDNRAYRVNILGNPKLDAHGNKIYVTHSDSAIDATDNFLEHFGVKGMHWGQRKEPVTVNTRAVTIKKTMPKEAQAFALSSKGKYQRKNADTAVTVVHQPGKRLTTKGGSNRKPSPDAIKVAASKRVAKSSTTDALSTKELQELVNRMNLEQQYSKLTATPPHPVKKFLGGLVGVGQQVVNENVKKTANEQASSYLLKKGLRQETDAEVTRREKREAAAKKAANS